MQAGRCGTQLSRWVNGNDFFERGLIGEPPMSIDFAALRQAGDCRLQRRRTLAVAGAAGLAVIIVLGAALIPRPGAGGATSGPLIPGCAVILGPTNTGSSSSSVLGSTALDQAAAQPAPDQRKAATADSSDPVRVAFATSPLAPTLSATVAVFDQSTADLTEPPDPLTAALWTSLRDLGVSVRIASQYRPLEFQSSGSADFAAARGRATSADGDGMLLVDIRRDGQGAPACQVSELDRRVTYPDGTVVDLTGGTAVSGSNLSGGFAAMIQAHAVANRPDGTMVTVRAANVVQPGDDDPTTAGIRASAGPPLTLTQVQELRSTRPSA